MFDHHLASQVESEAKLLELYLRISERHDCEIKFVPAPLAGGPRKHMMFNEPSRLRIEPLWLGN